MKIWKLLLSRDPVGNDVIEESARKAHAQADVLRTVRTENHFGESFQMYGFEVGRHRKGQAS